MTKTEQEAINNLSSIVREMQEENAKFREDVTAQVAKIDAKHLPIYHEQDILRVAQEGIGAAIKAALQTDYNSPVKKLVLSVVDEYSQELRTLIAESFTQVIRTDDFKQSIVNAFAHKVARSIISNNDGLFDQVSNELKKDAAFRAKMTLAVADVVNDCLKHREVEETLCPNTPT